MARISRRACMLSIGFIPAGLAVTNAFGQSESLVDYMNASGRDSSFAARKVLWTDFRPAEKYTGSAEQNTVFLKSLKSFDATPQIELLTNHANQGEEVKVKVKAADGASIGIETGLGLQSLNAPVGQEISLGKASMAGVFTVRVSNGILDSRYLLFLLAKDGGFSVELFGATAKSLQPSSPVIYQPQPTIAAALEKLFASLTKEKIQNALNGAIPVWLAENAAALGETMVVCAVGGPVPCMVSGAGNGWSAISAILTKLATDSSVLSNDEKELLKTVFAVGDAAGQLAASFWGIPQRKRLCELAGVGLVLSDSVAGQIDDAGVRVSLKIVLQSTKKYTALLCAKKL